MKSSRRTLLISFFTIFSLFLPSLTYSQDQTDFEVNTEYTITYQGSDSVIVEEEIHFICNNEDYFYPAQDERIFTLPDFSLNPDGSERAFKISTVQVEDENGDPIRFTTNETDTGVDVIFSEARDVTKWNSETYTVTYETRELIDKNGNIINIYIPGLPKEVDFLTEDPNLGLKTSYAFNTKIIVPSSSEDESYMYPIGVYKKSTEENRRIYSIDAEDRLGESGWIQLGSEQYYYFKLVQTTPKTDNIIPTEVNKYTNLVSTNVFEIPLPKEHPETNQKVLISRIDPEPLDIDLDIEGNYIAIFETPANQQSEIIIEGYVTLENIKELREIPDIPLDEYKQQITSDPALQRYLTEGQFWEINDPVVKEPALQILEGKEMLMELIRANYDFVVDNLDYSYSKVTGDNTRLGAVTTLNGGPAVCMEYSDTMIALLRAQGIPARAAIGYGNDPTGAENIIGDENALVQNIGHQWLEAWVPQYGWLSLDPTWGESERKYIGSNLDHILWYTIGSDDQKFIGTTIQSADPIYETTFESYDLYLRALSKTEFESITDLIPLEKIILEYKNVELDQTSMFLKTTSIGKVIVIAIPVIVILVLIFIITSVITALIRMSKRK